MREEAKRLFYIGKQLASNNASEIIEGIQKSRQYFSQICIPQYLNTLVMSLLDLFCSTKLSYIKNLVTDVISIAFSWVLTLPSRPQIVSKLTQSLKSNDQIMRILSLKMITNLYNLFTKDSSVYHYLLSKLGKVKNESGKLEQISVKQITKAIVCLRTLLENSEFLSSIFSNNLKQLNNLGGIDIKFILYLCVYANFEAKSYQNIIKTIWQMLESENSLKKGKKRQYFLRLLRKGCQKSYKCTILYFNKLKQHFPQLESQICKIQNFSFSFLKQPTNNFQLTLLQSPELLDFCYEYFTIFSIIPQQVQSFISFHVSSQVHQNNASDQILLLTFYLPENERNIDELITTKYQLDTKSTRQKERSLKISLLCGNYTLALKIIQNLMNICYEQKQAPMRMSVLFLFLSYTQLHLKQDNSCFLIFITILANLAISGNHHNLYYLSQQWKQYYNRLYHLDSSIEDDNLTHYRIEKEGSLKIEKSGQKMKIKCQQQLKQINFDIEEPWMALVQQTKTFSKIYFSKQTILDIFQQL